MHTFQSTPLKIKFAQADTAEGEFTGIASAFRDRPDRHGDIVVAGAYKRTLSQHSLEGTRPAMLWSHDQSRPVGAWIDLKETSAGLEAMGRLTLDVPEAKSARALMQAGALGLSIGYRVAPGGAEVRFDGVRMLKDLDLFEISLVAIPADTGAKIQAVKGYDLENPREFETAVRDALGLSSREAKRLAAGGWRALVRDGSKDESAELAAIAARLQSITQSLARQ